MSVTRVMPILSLLVVLIACSTSAPTSIPTPTPYPTYTPYPTLTPTPTSTPTETPSPTETPHHSVPTSTPMAIPTLTPTPTSTPVPTPTPYPTYTPYPTATHYPTQTPVPTPMPTPTPVPTPTPYPTYTPYPTATHYPTPTTVPTPTPTPTPVPTPTPYPTYTPYPTATTYPTPTPVPTPTPTYRAIPTPPPNPTFEAVVSKVRPSVVRLTRPDGGYGSGVIYDIQGETAYIVTNAHIVFDLARVDVTVRDTIVVEGTVLGVDIVQDLAVVTICCGTFHAVSFAPESFQRAGVEVFAMGYPLELPGEATVSVGIISAVRYAPGLMTDLLQTDAALNPGSSGGPMFSMMGELLGLNSFRYETTATGRPVDNVGFAIPASTVQAAVARLATVTPPPDSFGPIDVDLEHNPDNELVELYYAGVHVADFEVSASFRNPYDSQAHTWDYGFWIRVSGDYGGRWLKFILGGTARATGLIVSANVPGEADNILVVDYPNLNTGYGEWNALRLVVLGDWAELFVNDESRGFAQLDGVTHAGDIAVVTGSYEGSEEWGEVTRVRDFQVINLAGQEF